MSALSSAFFSILPFLLWAQAVGTPEAEPTLPSTAMPAPVQDQQEEAPVPGLAPTPTPDPADPDSVLPPGAVFVQVEPWHRWVLLFGEPGGTAPVWWGPPLSWIKIIGVLALLCWVGAWAFAGLKDRSRPGTRSSAFRVLDFAALVALIVGVISIAVQVAQSSDRLPALNVAGTSAAYLLGLACLVVILLWLEVLIWSAILRAKRIGDLLALGAMHLALAGGLVVGFLLPSGLVLISNGVDAEVGQRLLSRGVNLWGHHLILGSRLALTFMGFIALLRVLAMLSFEVVALRFRRLYALGRFSWVESFRKTRIPWAVVVIFVVILAFVHWFLQPPEDRRDAELSRLYVGTLMLLCSFLLTIMVAILTPISLPNDIRFQTIFTVVSKPVRRLEIVWGRILGFMAVVTVLLVLFGIGSRLYLYRTVELRIVALKGEIEDARQRGLVSAAEQLQAQVDQLETRFSARLPVTGALTFVDSLGKEQIKGIDVGQEMAVRSFVEGATQAEAIWQFGPNMIHPVDRLYPDPNRPLQPRVSRPVPLNLLLKSGTIEDLGNQAFELSFEKAQLEADREAGGGSAQDFSRLNREIEALDRRIAEVLERRDDLIGQANDLLAQAREAEAAGRAEEAEALRQQRQELSSPRVEVQMTFTVYRTTKGRVGEPVYASVRVTNPHVSGAVDTATFSIKEYYTNNFEFPAEVLVGSQGDLIIEVQCLSPTQYLGMSENDLFIVAQQGSFTVNYFKGLAGIWLKAMVLTAIGVWAGTFLSWPVALLTTVFFFISGEVFFSMLSDLAFAAVVGGGPFESLIRMVTHENQMTQLDPTGAVILAKTFDSVAVPIMSRLVYIIPNFSAMDLSNSVADGFAISNRALLENFLLALAYALPFSIVGYFILKNREVAA